MEVPEGSESEAEMESMKVDDVAESVTEELVNGGVYGRACEWRHVQPALQPEEQVVYAVGEAGSGGELRGHPSISTSECSQIDDHDAGHVTITASIAPAAPAGGQGDVEPAFEDRALQEDESGVGALDKYDTIESSRVGEEFVDCLKNEQLEVSQGSDEFGQEVGEASELDEFAPADEGYGVPEAPDTAECGIDVEEGLHLRELPACPGDTGGSDFALEGVDGSHYSEVVHVPEASSASDFIVDGEEGLFHTPVYEASHNEDSLDFSMEVEGDSNCTEAEVQSETAGVSDDASGAGEVQQLSHVNFADRAGDFALVAGGSSPDCNTEAAGVPQYEDHSAVDYSDHTVEGQKCSMIEAPPFAEAGNEAKALDASNYAVVIDRDGDADVFIHEENCLQHGTDSTTVAQEDIVSQQSAKSCEDVVHYTQMLAEACEDGNHNELFPIKSEVLDVGEPVAGTCMVDLSASSCEEVQIERLSLESHDGVQSEVLYCCEPAGEACMVDRAAISSEEMQIEQEIVPTHVGLPSTDEVVLPCEDLNAKLIHPCEGLNSELVHPCEDLNAVEASAKSCEGLEDAVSKDELTARFSPVASDFENVSRSCEDSVQVATEISATLDNSLKVGQPCEAPNSEMVPKSDEDRKQQDAEFIKPLNDSRNVCLSREDVVNGKELAKLTDKAVEAQRSGPFLEVKEVPVHRKASEYLKSRSVQLEDGVPLWVKWRGKWQPSIQCSTIDCPPATLKAKPSYSKKHYIVVYSPTARNYSWVDIQHTCRISECPLPLFSGTHESGREAVKDVNITRRRMLLKLGGEMLDISDRLHIKAVVESSQNVNVWKSFAKEAAAATTYAELGTLLVSLHLTIIGDYIKPSWMGKRHGHWKEECVKADSAAAIQKLTKELINAVLWDDVTPLWNEPDQPELDPQWENWKGEAFDEIDSEPDGKAEPKVSAKPLENGTSRKQISSGSGSKRFKEQARARRQRPQSSEAVESSQQKRSKLNPLSSTCVANLESPLVGRATTAFRSPLLQPQSLLQEQPCLPVLEADRCHEVISGSTLASLGGPLRPNKEYSSTQFLGSGESSLQVATPIPGSPSDASEGEDSKILERIQMGRNPSSTMSDGFLACESGLCSAFLKLKNRRCNRLVKEGTTFCWKHVYLADSESAGKKLALEGNFACDSGLCSAFLRRESRRCARQAKEGSKGYCGFHVHLSAGDSSIRKGEDHGVSKPEVMDVSMTLDLSPSMKEDRCKGITTRGMQCTHRTKDGSAFCVKHSLKGGPHGDKDEGKVQSLGASRMDWQNATEQGLCSPPGQVQGDPALTHQPGRDSAGGSSGVGMVKASESKCIEHVRGSDGVARKRKWLSSFFKKDAVQDSRSLVLPKQETLLPKSAESRMGPWSQCKGRTTRNDGQCSFRAREGYLYCTKHLMAMAGRAKSVAQPTARVEEVLATDVKGNSSVSAAEDLLRRYLKTLEGILPEGHRSDAQKHLVSWITAEAAKEYCMAEELLKLVTVELTRVQMVVQPMDIGEEKGVNSGSSILVNGCTPPLHVPDNGKSPEELVFSQGPPISVGGSNDSPKPQFHKPTTCGLCGMEFTMITELGRHWKISHRKEVCLFVKGYACRICGRLYTRKQTVVTHWKKRHQSLPITCPDWSVCFLCDTQHTDDDDLLEHVIAGHSDQLSSSKLKEMVMLNRAGTLGEPEGTGTLKCSECHEEFDTHWDLFHHSERTHKLLETDGKSLKMASVEEMKAGESTEVVSQAISRFGCRICGKKFSLLPDLGRHHQAEHMNMNKSGTPLVISSVKNAENLESCRMKLPIRRKSEEKVVESDHNIGHSRRKKKKLKFSSSSKKRSLERDMNEGKEALLFRMKAAVQTAQLRTQRHEKRGELSLGQSRKDLLSVSKGGQMLPGDFEGNGQSLIDDEKLLAMAQTTCCQSQLLASFEGRANIYPHQILSRLTQLASEANLKLEWQGEGYVCPEGCEKFSTSKASLKQGLEVGTMISSMPDKRTPPGNHLEILQSVLSNSNHVDKPAKLVTICEDLSGGQEPVPVVCVVDEDVIEHCKSILSKDLGGSPKDALQPWDSFNYIIRRRLDPSLGLDIENYKIGCGCEDAQCLPQSCDHVNLFDNDNADACDIYGKPMRGRFPYDDQGCIILEEGYLVYECNSSCRCQQTCSNRVLQKGVTVKLEVFRTVQKGWAVRAAQKIPCGTFVCEYVGEVLHDHEANKRGERYDQVGCSYLYDIDAHLDTTGLAGRSKPFVIDATKHGNVARFINHSCAPNLVNYQVLVESMDCQLAHIGLFASRDIEIGEELAYDYRYRLLPGKGCPCHCGAPNCRGRLY